MASRPPSPRCCSLLKDRAKQMVQCLQITNSKQMNKPVCQLGLCSAPVSLCWRAPCLWSLCSCWELAGGEVCQEGHLLRVFRLHPFCFPSFLLSIFFAFFPTAPPCGRGARRLTQATVLSPEDPCVPWCQLKTPQQVPAERRLTDAVRQHLLCHLLAEQYSGAMYIWV